MGTASAPLSSRDAATALDRALIKAQAASGALFAVFLLAHLVNTMVAVAGPSVYDGLQVQLRGAYQAPAIELALVAAPLLVHVVVSVWRAIRRRRQGLPPVRATRTRLQRWSAVVLLVFTFGHVLATRGASLALGVFPGFHGVAFTIVWIPAYFIPYYTLFSIAALYHAINGLALAAPRLGLRGPSSARTGLIVGVASTAGAIALALGIAGFAGLWHDVRAGAIDGPYARMLEQLGAADRDALRPEE